MTDCISDSRIRILAEDEDQVTNGLDLLDILDVLANLTQSHNSCILIPPVILHDHLLHNYSQNWQQNFLTDARNQSVYSLHSEMNLIVLHFSVLQFVLETFLRTHPFFFNFFVHRNLFKSIFYHLLEKENNNSFQFFLIFLHQTRHSFNNCNYKINCNFFQTEIINIFIVRNLINKLVNKIKFSFEKFWFSFGNVS